MTSVEHDFRLAKVSYLNIAIPMMPPEISRLMGHYRVDYKISGVFDVDPDDWDWKFENIGGDPALLRVEDPVPALEGTFEGDPTVGCLDNDEPVGPFVLYSSFSHGSWRETPDLDVPDGTWATIHGYPTGKIGPLGAKIRVEVYFNSTWVGGDAIKFDFVHVGLNDPLTFDDSSVLGVKSHSMGDLDAGYVQCIVDVDPAHAEGGWYPLMLRVNGNAMSYTHVYLHP